jgi:O-antigen/teichoic acid export membrane protein
VHVSKDQDELKLSPFRLFGLVLTERDRKVFNLMAMVFLPLLAASAIHAFRKDELHLVLGNAGMVIVFISYLLGREGLRVFAAEQDSLSEKVLDLMILGGFFIAATGWAYRLLS